MARYGTDVNATLLPVTPCTSVRISRRSVNTKTSRMILNASLGVSPVMRMPFEAAGERPYVKLSAVTQQAVQQTHSRPSLEAACRTRRCCATWPAFSAEPESVRGLEGCRRSVGRDAELLDSVSDPIRNAYSSVGQCSAAQR